MKAIQAYARQAKNKDLEADAFEIRFRAERRLGEVLKEQPKATGAAGIGKSNSAVPEKYRTQPATLKELGIDKKLSSQSQKTAKMPVMK